MNDPTVPGCLVVRGPAADTDLVADRCWALGATAIGELDGGVLEVGFDSDADARLACAELAAAWPALEVEVVDAGPALEAALDAWKPHARPISVGRLQVRPMWLEPDDEPPAADQVAVVVDPSRAFGYDHPSTRLCLVEVASRVRPGTSVLDVGCGGGMLSVAAALLGATPVVGLDVAEAAVDATHRAAVQNGVQIEASTRPVGEEKREFSLVLANLGEATLTRLAHAVAARVAPDGALVLAGLLDAQVPAVVAAYEAEGLELAEVGERSGWATPVFLRKSTTSGA